MNQPCFWLILLLRIRPLLAQTVFQVFQALNDGRCFSNSAGAIAVYSSTSQHMCSYMCYKNEVCALFSYIRENSTCVMYSAMTKTIYNSTTTLMPGTCDTWLLTWGDFVFFTINSKFVVPAGVTTLKILAVGGGGGGSDTNGGGGGSGEVSYIQVTAKAAQSYPITVGQGGKVNGNGGKSSFDKLLTAEGGRTRDGSGGCDGGFGGSGGGAGCPKATNTSGSGGIGGSDGTIGSTDNLAGMGQGSFTSFFSQFLLNTISTGQSAAGFESTASVQGGGGGAGGVLINGNGPSGTNGGCYISGVWNGPGPALGYGAGGSGGCLINNIKYPGGEGADGLIYVEFS